MDGNGLEGWNFCVDLPCRLLRGEIRESFWGFEALPNLTHVSSSDQIHSSF